MRLGRLMKFKENNELVSKLSLNYVKMDESWDKVFYVMISHT